MRRELESDFRSGIINKEEYDSSSTAPETSPVTAATGAGTEDDIIEARLREIRRRSPPSPQPGGKQTSTPAPRPSGQKQSKRLFCPKCGQAYGEGDRFCTGCGTALKPGGGKK
jgi:hypothetical protein